MKVSVGIQQPNYFPWLGYFHKIKLSDSFVFLDTVDIQTRTESSFTNRTRIKTKQGTQWLTVPIKKGNSKKIKDVIIDNIQPWKQKHLNTLFHAYKKAQFFDYGYRVVEKLILNDFEKLSDFNIASITFLCDEFNLKAQLIKASEMDIDETDKNRRLISICKKLKGNTYLSGEGGKKYNDMNLFSDHQIKVNYVDFSVPAYHQLYGEFVNGLSMIDTLFNCGENTAQLI